MVEVACYSSVLASQLEINSAATDAASNTFRIFGRQERARPLPAVGFTYTTAGDDEQIQEQIDLESLTRLSCCPTRLVLSIKTHSAEGARLAASTLRRSSIALRRPRQQLQPRCFQQESC